MMSESWIVNGSHSKEMFLKHVETLTEQHPYLCFEWFTGKPTSVKQTASLHVYLRQVAQGLNEKGFSVSTFFKEGVEIPFSEEIVKDNIWRPIQKAVVQKDSTKDLTTTETQQVFEIVNRAVGERGIHVPWPSRSNS